MHRPFFHDSLANLEAQLAERQSDPEWLNLLATELTFRSTKKAQELQLHVAKLLQARLGTIGTEPDLPVMIGQETVALQKGPSHSPMVSKLKTEDFNKPITNLPQDLLSTWTALEVLSPQTFRREQDLAGAGGSIASLRQGSLPWEGAGERSKPNYKLYYQVVLGTIRFDRAIEDLLAVYVDSRVERPSVQGEAILAVVVVDNKGRLVDDPAVAISSFGWGAPQALGGDLHKLAEWSTVEAILVQKLDQLLRLHDEEGKELPLTRAVLQNTASFLIKELGVPAEWVSGNMFAIRTYEYYKSGETPEPLLLNSFFLGDILMVRAAWEEYAPELLRRYIGVKPPASREDLLHDRMALERIVAPGNFPPARWPGPGRHPLVLLQQAAVNSAMGELSEDGLLAVNGPPGTGKTTLLRDVVASLVTARAEAMCAFDEPAAAFRATKEKVPAGAGFWTLYELDSRLKGFEMLIASSNNKAVENVSAELPGMKAVADDATELRYFSGLAGALLDRECWGLIAAVLGNGANRSKFKQTFWFDKENGLATYLAEAAGTPQFLDEPPEEGKPPGKRKPRIIIEEQPPVGAEEANRRWIRARTDFINALTASKNALGRLENIRSTVFRYQKLRVEIVSLEEELIVQKALLKRIQDELEAIIAAIVSATEALNLARILEREHDGKHPGFLAFLFRRNVFRSWKTERVILRIKTANADQELGKLARLKSDSENAVHISNQKIVVIEAQHRRFHDQFVEAESVLSAAKKQLGSQLIDESFWQQTHHELQLTSPWCDSATQRLRDNVFIQAIRLHKAFIDAAAKPLRHNIGALMGAFGRGMPDEEKRRLVPDLWSSLFLIVPCVSTTFASVERMLGPLPARSLGWLLIDEAGQALPQAAVGALWRIQRAVVVGDPIQIEPVVTLPATLTQNICRLFGVDPLRFNAPEASVQTLADAATAYFGEFEGAFGSRTVGVPLLVHRRCEEPMFGISNSIAYERQMVSAKRPAKSPIRDCLGPSRWISVQGTAQDKWCPEEGAVVLILLRQLRAEKVVPDIYIVTPFVIVADNLRKVIRDSGILTGWVENEMTWPYERIGTVHTVQGREADGVILVLGAPLSQQTGARAWAGGRPNLLNVAVTRAKEVLYVVGNRDHWSNAGVFRALSDALPAS
ncbi:MAG: hypothetical protein JST68_22075 [Bacteroidetes bacterium]|nr:hypothetical protein [Bacteroidota bacterium]